MGNTKGSPVDAIRRLGLRSADYDRVGRLSSDGMYMNQEFHLLSRFEIGRR